MANVAELIDAYIKLRDKKKKIKERHAEELKDTNEKMDRLEMGLLFHLSGEGADSIRTESGTVYKIKRSSVKVQNWDEALKYVLDNNLTHMLEKRLAKSAVEEFLEANKTTPPGVSITTDLGVGIRRK